MMKKRIISTLLLSTVLLAAAASVSPVIADTTDSQIEQQNKTISSAQSAKAKAQEQVNTLQSQVDKLKTEQADAKAKLNKITASSEKLNTQIATLYKNIQERKVNLKAQARSAQTDSSATSYLDAIVNSKSITDAAQKITAMATFTSASQQMIKQQERDQAALNAKSADLKKNYTQYSSLYNSLASQSKEIATQEAQLQVATLSYQETIATAQSTKSSLETKKAAAEKAAKAAAAKQATYEAKQKAAAKAQVVSTDTTSNSGTTTNGSSSGGGSTDNNTNTDNNGTDNNNSGGGTGSAGYNPYSGGGCTDFVWQYFAAKGIYIGNISPGNGGDWATYGVSEGVLHTTAAAPGVIASGNTTQFDGYANSPYGHVAIVTAVHANGTFDVIEGGLSSGWWNHVRKNLSPSGVTFLYPN